MAGQSHEAVVSNYNDSRTGQSSSSDWNSNATGEQIMAYETHLKRSDMIRCALCSDAPCDQACPCFEPSAILRSVWLDNEDYAAACIPEQQPCINCSAPCEDACVRPHEVPIRNLMMRLNEEVSPLIEGSQPADESLLKCDFCGIPLENPFLLSSSVVASTYDMCARAFEAGWAGAAFKTVCNFDIHEASPRFSAITGDSGSIVGFKNIEQLSDHSLTENLEIFRKLKKNYPTKLILASIMGRNEAEWEELARLCDENGADALELNFSCPNMEAGGLGSDIGQNPELIERFTAAARRGTNKPILAKMTPNAPVMTLAAEAAKRGGADGIAAINTIKSIMNVNPYTYISSPAVHGFSAVGGYSGNAVKPIALYYIASLRKDPALADMHISGMGGIETWRDAVEFLLLGAGSVQVTTAVMQYGYRIIDDLKSGLNQYLAWRGNTPVKEIIGLGQESLSETTDILERDTILYPVFNRETCIGCGRCEISCRDGGHQAIHLNAMRKPVLDGRKCVGCHLCLLVCPTRSIASSIRRTVRPAGKRD